MMIDPNSMINQIHADIEGVAETGFPLDVFPDEIQKIVYELVTYENFNLEYTASVVLSVFATALGNTHRVNIKGKWVASCALYMMLVGRPGLGKTPPLNYLYSPLRDFDQQMLDKARQDYEQYKQLTVGKKENGSSEQMEKPRFPQTIISDFTQEAMLSIHYDNPRGIAIVVDEIMGLFNSVKRYSAKSTLIQDLLSAYSGMSLKAVRKTEDFPLTIPVPCINIIGGIQTGLLSDVMTREYVSNGLIDRFLFVYPKNTKIPEWQIGIDKKQRPDTMSRWTRIIRRVIDLPLDVKEEGNTIVPKELEFTNDAMIHFYTWNNGIINMVNGIENDNDVESRIMKVNGNAARLALILQAMRWTVGECQLNNIDIESVKGAIRLIDYYEDSYKRIQAVTDSGIVRGKPDDLLDMLGDTFSSKDAELAGLSLGISRRTVYNQLDKLCKSPEPSIIRLKQGLYQKKVHDCTDAQCTTAQAENPNAYKNDADTIVQSAEVQSASDAQEASKEDEKEEGGSDE
jgi:hypothetical protein